MVANNCIFDNFWHIASISQKRVGIFSSSILYKYFLSISFGKIGSIKSSIFFIVGNFHTEKSFHYYFFILRFMSKICRQFFQIYWNACLIFVLRRSLPKICGHEEEGVHQNPQYTGQHHFHPVPHDHDFCERVVINVRMNKTNKNHDHQHKLVTKTSRPWPLWIFTLDQLSRFQNRIQTSVLDYQYKSFTFISE